MASCLADFIFGGAGGEESGLWGSCGPRLEYLLRYDYVDVWGMCVTMVLHCGGLLLYRYNWLTLPS